MIVVKGESHKLSCYVYESVVIVDIIYKVSCCVLEGDSDNGKGRESQSDMLCLGRRGDSGQERFTKYVVFRKARW